MPKKSNYISPKFAHKLWEIIVKKKTAKIIKKKRRKTKTSNSKKRVNWRPSEGRLGVEFEQKWQIYDNCQLLAAGTEKFPFPVIQNPFSLLLCFLFINFRCAYMEKETDNEILISLLSYSLKIYFWEVLKKQYEYEILIP